MYLCVQNPGVAPVEGYTLLGVSTTRDCGVEGAIGQFGSGTKHAINVLLRAGLKVFVYCGKTRLDFQVRDEEVDDGLIRKPIKRVVCKLGGTSTRTIDLGWVLDFGSIDWDDVSMALREFVSNAIDRTVREEAGEFIPAIDSGRLSVSLVEDPRVKAKDGYTRVYVEADALVRQYLMELPKRFLHFSARPEDVKLSLLPKANRSLSGGKAAVIYRAGVFVREINEPGEVCASVYDYNFKPSELQIDECRNSNDYEVKAAISRLYRKASMQELIPVFSALVEQRPVLEEDIDPYYAAPSWETPTDEQTSNWQQAWAAVAADAILCGPSEVIADFIRKKGFAVKPVRSQTFVDTAARYGIRTAKGILSENERKGREKLPPTSVAVAAVDEVWGWLAAYGLTNGCEKPPVGCFRDVMDAGSRTLGFCDASGVYLEQAHASGRTKMVLKTALEECVHWVTKAADNSRDFQDFVLQMLVEMAA